METRYCSMSTKCYQLSGGDDYIRQIGILKISIQDEININEDIFLSQLDRAKKNYSDYIKFNIAPDGNNIGYEKIIKTIKERFFN